MKSTLERERGAFRNVDAFVDLLQAPLHFGLVEVPVPRVDRFELAAVDRNARITKYRSMRRQSITNSRQTLRIASIGKAFRAYEPAIDLFPVDLWFAPLALGLVPLLLRECAWSYLGTK